VRKTGGVWPLSDVDATFFAPFPQEKRMIRHIARVARSVCAASALVATALFSPAPAEQIVVNDNRIPSGTLAGGVLTIHLDAREGEWHPDADSSAGIVVRAFAGDGGPLQVPGPLIRVPQGTEIHAFVHNSLSRRLFLHGLNTRGSAAGGNDTVSVGAGGERDIRFTASQVGTFYYWGAASPAPTIGGRAPLDTVNAPSTISNRSSVDAELSGAFVVDAPGRPPLPDRIFLVGFWTKRGSIDTMAIMRVSINGKSWPHTERLSYHLGDSVRFRMINAGSGAHPMHLHGFYYRVDTRGAEQVSQDLSHEESPIMVNTERMASGQTFSLTWVPTREGNWIFHCHDPFHVLPGRPIDGSPRPRMSQAHEMLDMGGPVMGISVLPASGRSTAVAEVRARRRLRMIASADIGSTPDAPSYSYVLDDGRKPAAHSHVAGPTFVLKRGEPVSITVVNRLDEPTSVHWHGIELDSYYDGVAGFGGHPGHISPEIAPNDSFVARFTPPRSGTFMYHPHVNEFRQQQAGLDGALLVVDAPAVRDSTTDIAWLVTTPRLQSEDGTVYVNGSATPPAQNLRAGVRYRIRLMNLHNSRPGLNVKITRASQPLTWRALAKDGMDLPPGRATVRASVQLLANGETYDFEFTAPEAGELRLEIAANRGDLLFAMPIKVR
jgi:manganese oxidase